MIINEEFLTVSTLLVDQIGAQSSSVKSQDFEVTIADMSANHNSRHIIEQLWRMYMDSREKPQMGDCLPVTQAFIWTLVYGS